MPDKITVVSRKFDGSLGKTWTCDLIERRGELVIMLGVFDRQIIHPHLGTVEKGTISYEYYWLDKYFNVFKFVERDGTFRNFYCNINLPPTFIEGILDYVDLELDLLVEKDGKVLVLDVEEYEETVKNSDGEKGLRERVDAALAELREMIAERRFPFDQDLA